MHLQIGTGSAQQVVGKELALWITSPRNASTVYKKGQSWTMLCQHYHRLHSIEYLVHTLAEFSINATFWKHFFSLMQLSEHSPSRDSISASDSGPSTKLGQYAVF